MDSWGVFWKVLVLSTVWLGAIEMGPGEGVVSGLGSGGRRLSQAPLKPWGF